MTIKNKFLRYAIIFLALALIIASYYIPAPEGMTQSMFAVLGILVATVILWFTVSISWPSLLCILALGFIPELGGFKGLFSDILLSDDLVIIFVVLSCVLSFALSKTMMFKRIAFKFLSSEYAKKSPWRLIISLFTAVMVIGCFVPPVILYVSLLPVIESIMEIAGIKKGDKLGSMFVIGLAFTASISSGMTPFSHLLCAIACEKANIVINYGEYMLMAVPTGIVLMTLMLLVFRFIMRPDTSVLRDIDLTNLSKDLTKIKSEEIIGFIVYGIINVMMIVPSISLSVLPSVERIVTSVIFVLIAFFMVFGFDRGMKSMMEINTKKMSNPAGIFSIFSISVFVTSVILTILGHEILASLLMVILVVIFIVSVIV